MARKRLVFMLLGLATALMLTQMLVVAQDKGTPNPTSATDYPLATLTTTPVESNAQTIQIGGRVEIHFDPNETKQYIYTFRGQAKEAVTIILSAVEGNVPSAELILPNQREVSLNSETIDGNTIRETLRYYVLPSDGEYQIKIYAYGQAGSAVLKFSKATTIPISFFTLIKGSLSDTQDAIGYQFAGKAGQQVTVDIHANSFLPVVELHCGLPDECGQKLTTNGNDNNQTLIYSLPKDRDYILIVRQQKNGGTFKLVVSPLQPTVIRYGDHVEAEFSDAKAIQQYSFEAHFGDIVQIHVKGDGKIDTQLALWQGINLITTDDDGGNALDPEIINTMLYGDGQYTIILRPYTFGESGKVTLLLERTPVPSLDNGSQTLHLTPKFTSMMATFTGVAGEKACLSIHTNDGESSRETRIEVRQSGQDIMNASTVGNEGASIDFITPKDGEVQIFLTGSSPTELKLEHLGK